MVETAKVFTNGGSQAVRLPKSCRVQGEEVDVQRVGSITMIIPKDTKWDSMRKSLDLFTDDFMTDRGDLIEMDRREEL
ncbi:MAG: type II toxin-antitoxin system VapB family antitoxin [Lachnospiraceae bacterium]|nr:type II toxin-antitoxin system VapB family antitoxin [Lachnospiraceae bacterium]